MDLSQLPTVADAPLPATYEAARNALVTCTKLDECHDWADKSAALASYARQSEDESLEKMAQRIRARAIKRCGELLRQIGTDTAGRKRHKNNYGSTSIISRSEAARVAGLSQDEKARALRIASIPDEEFEALIESDDPPGIMELEALGTKKTPRVIDVTGGRDPAAFKAATQALGALRRFLEFADNTAPSLAASGLHDDEWQTAVDLIGRATVWLTNFRKDLRRGS